MLFRLLGLIGAGTFVVNGFKVITDPLCESVIFGAGGRVLKYSCVETASYSSGDVSGNLAGIGMIGIGLVLTFFALRGSRSRY